MGIEINGPKIYFTIPIFGGLDVNETLVNSWIVIGIIFVLCLILTRKLEKVPRKRTQQIAEKLVTMADKLVVQTMGERNKKFTPYIMTLMAFSAIGSLISLVGLRSITADINVTLAWGLLTFFLIWISGIRTHGIGYFKGLISPTPVMLPLNLISEVSTPFSLAFRHFGNITAGMIISILVYGALGAAAAAVFGIALPIFQIGVPAVLSVYFDVFSGCMQAFIFSMLTMVYVSNANAPDEA